MTTAVILAGGLGTRLRSAVPELPKPMAPISGRPFLAYQLDYWIKQGVSRFVLSVGYRHEVVIDHFGDRYKDAELDYVIETTPLGTGGGFLLAAEKVDKNEAFLLLNGDTYFAVNLNILIEFARKNHASWCFSLFRTNEEGRYMGMDVTPQGQVISLKSGKGQSERLANGGVYWVNPGAVLDERFSAGDKVSLEDDIFPAAMVSGQFLFGIEFSGIFIDIGVPDDYYHALTLLTQ
ncbi:sugar phosphate nucleotidyltransferase [Methylotuvimicrobium sp. KM1]|uniref:sugar phosphate nucleotidyltransferase n=1 Tax=Methylotuvimicrobium sp. KM1 TaxID=3377707 RepID=UPI00384F20FB